MNIYVDESRSYGCDGIWCHMWTDGEDEELDSFAGKLGLKKEWSHVSHGMIGRFYHYDLRPSKKKIAIMHGAKQVRLRDYIKEIMKSRVP